MDIAPCGSWKSPITSDLIVAQSIVLSEIRIDGGQPYWLERRPHEAGRSVVVSARDLLPQPFDVRTRAHEYGGGAWTVLDGTLYFSHDRDQRLYRLERAAAQPEPLTPEGPFRYADGIIDTRHQLWIGVREDHSASGYEPVNTLVAIDLSRPNAGRLLAEGHDFYSSPKLSPDGAWLAYLAWDHPQMPWIGTTLYLMPLDETGTPAGDTITVAGGTEESIVQPEWSPDGMTLFFVSDRTGWWNLYRSAWPGRNIEAVLPMNAEFAQAQWVFGMSAYAFAGRGRLVCSYASKGLGQLGVIDLASGKLTPLDLPYSEFSSVRAEEDRVVFRAGSPSIPTSFVHLDVTTGKTEILKKSTELADDPNLVRYFSCAQSVEFPTEGNRTAFGLFYPAFNPDYRPAEGDRPPLVVTCHGGPTSAASSTLDLRIQYYTSRGVSVFDVNYGGSTGFGRAYRLRLDGNWGIVDVEDCINGARHLASEGWVDGSRSVITGGSAGGYTALAALTSREYFRGGGCHFGVSDLAALARETHKFESHYLESLVGPYPEREDLYRFRSPIFQSDRLSVPVIFFQGEEDRVVPPSQTEIMVEKLRQRGVPVGYLLFSGEQHGFRKAENIKRALDAELFFYAVNVFRIAQRF